MLLEVFELSRRSSQSSNPRFICPHPEINNIRKNTYEN